MKTAYFMTTQRLEFRTWQLADLQLAMDLWGDFKVTRLFDGRGPLSQAQVQDRLHREIQSQTNHGIQYWPLFHRGTGDHIGCAGLRPYDPTKGIFEMGIHIKSDHWRHGYATEAARAVMDHAFDTLSAKALFAGHNPRNTGSRQLLLKMGFQYTHDEFYEPTGLDHPSYLFHRDQRPTD